MNQEAFSRIAADARARSLRITGSAMYDVVLALLPATFFGVWHFGLHALLVILMSVVSAVTAEWVFDYLSEKPNTLRDGSAIVTGLLLALCLPPSVPLYVPYIGAVFAIVVVKGFFGGLGRNFMNPAMAGYVFLLLSFGTAMARYEVDGVTSATPLSALAAGTGANVLQIWTGHAGGVIGCSALGLLIGGLYLWVMNRIPWQTPAGVLVSFTVILCVCGSHSIDPVYLLTQLGGGGLILAAFFLAADPVTSPVTGAGQLLFGVCVGTLGGLFRIYGGSPDAMGCALILSNLAVPLLDEYAISLPFAAKASAQEREAGKRYAHPAAVAALAVAVCVALLAGVQSLTGGASEAGSLEKNREAYQALIGSDAVSFAIGSRAADAIADLGGGTYGTDFGNTVIQELVLASDADGTLLGSIVSVTSNDGRDAPITLQAGVRTDGTLTGIRYTDLQETPNLGMKVGEPAFMDQFVNQKAGRLTLGGEIAAVSGATISSQAVVNAVNAALDFAAAYGKE